MIKNIRINNFYSIGETQELSFEILSKDILDDSSANIFPDLNVNLVNCLVGHNASGKTTALKAIAFIFWMMTESYTVMKPNENIPFHTHKLNKNGRAKIEIEFFNDQDIYKYSIVLDKRMIHSEYFGKRIKRGYSRIFAYERNEIGWINFNSTKIDINKNDLNRFKERKNVSILNSLIETGYLPELLFLKNSKWNVTNIGYVARHPFSEFLNISKSLYLDDRLRKEALSFIDSIDLGISDFDFSEVEIKRNESDELDNQFIIECIHESNVGQFKLPLLQESNGTIHGLQILTDILPILKNGGIVVLDEIESGLHPYVTKKLISLFENKKTNPKLAQLIFSTHQHMLLNDRSKTQIFLTEKNSSNCETEIYRLDEVEGIRNDENYFLKYLSGTYGAIPNIKWISV